MFGFNKKLGVSFSMKRLLGITGMKSSFAQKTGVPTTRGRLERKIGGQILKVIFGKKK